MGGGDRTPQTASALTTYRTPHTTYHIPQTTDHRPHTTYHPHTPPQTPTAPAPTPFTHYHLHQAREKAHEEVLSATESTPAVEEALRFYAEYGDEARLTALLERGIVNVMTTDKVGG